MSKLEQFVVIGENVHATRIVRRTDPRVGTDHEGREAVVFVDGEGATRHLLVTEAERASANYLEGRIKHVRIAIQTAMAGLEPDASTALAYLETIVHGQVEAGSHFLDLNVDEVSLEPAGQVEAMRWLVRAVTSWTSVPLAIDSPSIGVLEAGLEEATRDGAVPMLNSASVERPGVLDLAVESGAPVVVTAAGESGMPSDTEGRVANATRIVELALGRGVPLDRIYVDPLVFPIAVDGASGGHCLAAYLQLRGRFAPELRLTGGMSNVSFGLPHRHLLNDAFLTLAIEAGADSGILDPIASPPARALALDRSSRPVQLAVDALTGVDRGCRAYLKAYRAGELDIAGTTA